MAPPPHPSGSIRPWPPSPPPARAHGSAAAAGRSHLGTTELLAADSLRRAQARAFARRLPAGAIAVDLDGSSGRFTTDIGDVVVAVGHASTRIPTTATTAVLAVVASLENLPLAGRSVGGAWSDHALTAIPAAALPVVLAEVHRVLSDGALADLRLTGTDHANSATAAGTADIRPAGAGPDTDRSDLDLLGALLSGAGLEVLAAQRSGAHVRVRAERIATLADTVGPDMRMLVVGLGPSMHAVAAGVPFARPEDRFWEAAVRAGVVCRPHDARHALSAHGIGLTDLVKRATNGAAELTPAEYRQGMRRLEQLVQWAQPRVVCFVGLSGWRAAVDRDARPGLQATALAGRPCYVMPSTIGAAAHSQDDLSQHLGAAAMLADRS